MRRAICWAVLTLLFSSGAAFAQRTHLPVSHPIAPAHHAPHPHVHFVVLHRFHGPYFIPQVVQYPLFYPVPYPVGYAMDTYVAPAPAYVFLGSDSPARPQLVFKDGTTYTVSDYWRVHDQLHFVTVEDGGTKSVPHSVAFETLDEQKTKDLATAQGFKFVLRDKPVEEWLQHRDDHTARRTRKSVQR